MIAIEHDCNRKMIATEKSATQNHVLVLNQGSDNLQRLDTLLAQLRCPVEWTHSPEQAMWKAQQISPCLVILAGSPYDWSRHMVHRFRTMNDQCSMTIVGLTDSHAPSWLRQEDNPGVDGFLVKPIDQDVLKSLVHSARVRQNWCTAC
jgi:AmiR/NasT family two-component response regulator